MKKPKVFIISGPSGSGKTTLHDMLLKSPALKGRLQKTVSVTTRAPREGEKNGRDYVFVSKKMFEHKVQAGHFLEYEQVFDNYYGTTKKAVRDILAKDKHVLLCIDVKGAKTVRKAFPKAVTIFVKTPNISELKKRLQSRGTENPKSLKLRIDMAKEELEEESAYQYSVVNDTLPKAFKVLEKAVLAEISA